MLRYLACLIATIGLIGCDSTDETQPTDECQDCDTTRLGDSVFFEMVQLSHYDDHLFFYDSTGRHQVCNAQDYEGHFDHKIANISGRQVDACVDTLDRKYLYASDISIIETCLPEVDTIETTRDLLETAWRFLRIKTQDEVMEVPCEAQGSGFSIDATDNNGFYMIFSIGGVSCGSGVAVQGDSLFVVLDQCTLNVTETVAASEFSGTYIGLITGNKPDSTTMTYAINKNFLTLTNPQNNMSAELYAP